jgi:M6 family metalloprotease-like protein
MTVRSTLLLGAVFTLPIVATAESRPLVTLLMQLPGPATPKDSQWLPQSISVKANIPDHQRMTSDITTTDVANGSCSALFGIGLDISLTHQRPADLIVALSSVSRDGRSILKTITVYDGPTAASGLTDAEALKIPFLTKTFYDSTLTASSDCARWRLTITDTAFNNTGKLLSWTLSRRIAWFPFAHGRDYYTKLLFGGVTPNVADYYREVSRDNFTFHNAGMYGPVVWSSGPSTLSSSDDIRIVDKQHVADVVHLLEKSGFDFKSYDKNNDHVISREELAILAIDNTNDTGGATRIGPNNGCTTLDNTPSYSVCAQVVLIQQQMDFETLTHELSHQSTGTVDLYADTCFSLGLTLMSCTLQSGPDNKNSVYLDPWHRVKAGWMSPNDLGFGNYELGDETWTNFFGVKSHPATVRNPADSHEYFLFEYRRAGGYDRNVADTGLVVWHVKENADGSAYKGTDGKETEGHAIYAVSPDNDRGGSKVWNAADGNFVLHWADHTTLPFTFWVADVEQSPNSVILNVKSISPQNQPPRITIVRPADGSSGPMGFGTPTIFEARVTDPEDGSNGLRINWSSDADGPLGTGSLIGYPFITPGDRVVTVTARDRFGATAQKSIKYTLNNVLPSATIFFPMQNATYFRNVPVALSGTARTPALFALPCSQLTWTVDRDPLHRDACL